jgi:hypothetical protein
MVAPANEITFRQYLSFFLGQQISLLGSSIAQFAIVWWINLVTASTLYLALAAFVGFVPMVVARALTRLRWVKPCPKNRNRIQNTQPLFLIECVYPVKLKTSSRLLILLTSEESSMFLPSRSMRSACMPTARDPL